MRSNKVTSTFNSVLAPFIEQFIQQMRACGYRYTTSAESLRQLDHYLLESGLNTVALTKVMIAPWLTKRTHEAASTQQHRISLVRQFARFLNRLGYPAYVPDSTFQVKSSSSFTPYIFTQEELRKLFDSVEKIVSTAHAPQRHVVMPEVFHLLYGCGFRIREVLKLRVRDVDLQRGVVIVRDGKFGKDRLVPPAPALLARLQRYEAAMGCRPDDAVYFPSPTGGVCSYPSLSTLFRKLLFQSGIPYRGRGKGPRLHDLRHTFAVHTVMRWYRQGMDLNAKLPLLATYMGHAHLRGAYYYLHLTAEFFPDLINRVNKAFGDVIPTEVAV